MRVANGAVVGRCLWCWLFSCSKLISCSTDLQEPSSPTEGPPDAELCLRKMGWVLLKRDHNKCNPPLGSFCSVTLSLLPSVGGDGRFMQSLVYSSFVPLVVGEENRTIVLDASSPSWRGAPIVRSNFKRLRGGFFQTKFLFSNKPTPEPFTAPSFPHLLPSKGGEGRLRIVFSNPYLLAVGTNILSSEVRHPYFTKRPH